MKKIISFLIICQVIIISVYSLTLVRGYAISSLINYNTSSLNLLFFDDQEYMYFLELIEENQVNITRPVFINSNTVVISTNDFTLGNRISLNNGRFPNIGSNEFISNVSTNEDSQVGIFTNITPGFSVSIRDIADPTNVQFSGVYFINSIDFEVVDTFVYLLNQNIYSAEILSINNQVNFLNQITMVQVLELFAMAIILFVSICLSFVNYSINKLKTNAILGVLGYNKFKVTQIFSFELIKIIVFSYIVSYIIILVYIIAFSYTSFLNLISIWFFIIALILSFMYYITAMFFMAIYLYTTKATNLLKGKKPHFFLQFLTHSAKILCTISVLVFGLLAINNFMELRVRAETFSNWEATQNLHAINTYFVGQHSGYNGFALAHDIYIRKENLYQSLSTSMDAFIMRDSNVHFADNGFYPYIDMENAPSLNISPRGFNVTVSMNYFLFNPIYTVDHTPVEEQVIISPYVLNILVPEYLSPYEYEIRNLYLDYFYFSKVDIDRIYRPRIGGTPLEIDIKDLYINIIYIHDGQYFFTPNTTTRPEYGNRIFDVIAIIDTGSFHPHVRSINMQNGFYFFSDSIDTRGSIMQYLYEHELVHVIRSTRSVFDENANAIVELRTQTFRMIGFIVGLLVSSITIIYALVSNYVDRNKQRLFLKFITGYSFFERNTAFLYIVTICTVVISFILTIHFGLLSLLIGTLIVCLDLVTVYFADKNIIKKSFSKVMKGAL